MARHHLCMAIYFKSTDVCRLKRSPPLTGGQIWQLAVLLAFMLLCSAQDSLYCVSPDANSTLNEEQCQTFAHYYQNSSFYFRSSTTFIFLPGTHAFDLNNVLSIESLEDIAFVGWDAFINGVGFHHSKNIESRSKLLCSEGSAFSFTNATNVSLIDLTLLNCSANMTNYLGVTVFSIFVSDVQSFNMTGVSIQNGSGLVGATVLDQSFVSNSSFLRLDTAVQLFNSKVSLSSCTFSFCDTAINASDGIYEIDDSNFETVRFALAVSYDSYVTVDGSAFSSAEYGILSLRNAVFISNCHFEANLYAVGLLDSSSDITNCTFTRNGNGGYYQKSTVHHTNCLYDANNSSSIEAYYSMLIFTGHVQFRNSFSADYGGAVYLGDSTAYLTAPVDVLFAQNTAVLSGGAVYSLTDFNALSYESCFFQLTDRTGTLEKPNIHLSFYDNAAQEAGNVFYGSLSSCILDNSDIPNYDTRNLSPLDILIALSVIVHAANNVSNTAADPNKVCLCTATGDFYCPDPDTRLSVQVYPGQGLTIPIVSVDEYNQSTPSIVFSLNNSTILSVFRTQTRCFDFLVPAEVDREVSLVTQTSFLSSFSPLRLSVVILPCPPGFTLDRFLLSCRCSDLLRQNGLLCFITNQTVQKPVNGWIGILNRDTLIIGSACAPETCRAEAIFVNLSDEASLNLQCTGRHGGILCGGCEVGSSALLGSYRCSRCSQSYHLFLLVAFAAMGVGLVGLLFILNLTVSTGIINGIVFYANIIKSNFNVIFPGKSTSGFVSFLSVFVSWLNLDFGIESCFYNGMDNYAKAWLEFAFPLYIFAIVSMIVIASRLSGRVSRWCRHNVVSAIATLGLLIYSKIVQNVTFIFSYVRLDTGNSSFDRVRWFYDGNVAYLGGRHIVLFVAALLVTFTYVIPFTVILLFTPCLQSKSHMKGLRWINKLKPFLDSYQAPFKDRYRFWTGALLLIRFVLYLFIAASISSTANLLAVVMAVLFPLVCILGLSVYKNWVLTALEGFLYINAVMLAIFVYLGPGDVNHKVIVSLGVGTAFFCFVGIIMYQVHKKIGLTLPCSQTIKRFMRGQRKRQQGSLRVSVDKDSLYSESETELRRTLIN